MSDLENPILTFPISQYSHCRKLQICMKWEKTREIAAKCWVKLMYKLYNIFSFIYTTICSFSFYKYLNKVIIINKKISTHIKIWEFLTQTISLNDRNWVNGLSCGRFRIKMTENFWAKTWNSFLKINEEGSISRIAIIILAPIYTLSEKKWLVHYWTK